MARAHIKPMDSDVKYPGEGTIPCKHCGRPTRMLGTQLCDKCWELERRVQDDVLLTRSILDEVPCRTFEEWQATRRFLPDASALGDDGNNPYFRTEGGPVGPAPVLMYAGEYMIGLVTRHWPEPARSEGQFHLLLGNMELVTDDLDRLERELYDFYAGGVTTG